jgi:hypothetical protein
MADRFDKKFFSIVINMNNPNSMNQDIEEFKKYFSDGYDENFDLVQVSDHIQKLRSNKRDRQRMPAIALHGMMQRSGTNYLGELVRLHPDVFAHPNQLYEVPFLRSLKGLLDFQTNFTEAFPASNERIGENGLLAIFADSFMEYLHSYVPAGKRMLFKTPSVRYLNYFFTLFPDENLIILIRDGRDVVQSAVKSWPHRNFDRLCYEWEVSAKMCINFGNSNLNYVKSYLVVKYEDIFADPKKNVINIYQKFGLDVAKYPLNQIEAVPLFGSSTVQPNGEVTWDARIRRPSDFNPIGRWQAWTPEMKQTFKEIAGQSLIDLGYEDSFDW